MSRARDGGNGDVEKQMELLYFGDRINKTF